MNSINTEFKNESDIIMSDRIYYEIVSACNLRCIHCSDLLQDSFEELSVKSVIKFHSEIIKHGINNSVVTGGEPTLHKDFEELVVGLSKFGSVLITSNASVVDYELMKKILKDNPNISLQISMDGKNRNTFDLIRGKGTFDKVIGLINYLLENNLNKQLGFSMTIMQQNIDEVYDMICFARDKKIGFLHFPALLPVGLAKEKWDKIAPTSEQQIQIEELIITEMIKDDDETKISSNRIDQVLTRAMYGTKADCLKNFTIKVTPNGNILPCPAASDSSLSLGKIDDDNIASLIIDKFIERSKEYELLTKYELSGCKECNVKSNCNGRFCSNCGILTETKSSYGEYGCQITHRHLQNALKELNSHEI